MTTDKTRQLFFDTKFFLFFLLLPGGIMLLIKRVIDQYGVIELNNQTQMQTRTTDQK